MNEKEITKKLKEKTVFNFQEMQRILNKSPEYTKIVLNRLTKKGAITKIKKNSYTLQEDIYVIATNITYPSYLSFWSAINYKGYTEQILNTIQIATTKRIKDIFFQGYKIEFIKVNSMFGYEKVDTSFGEMFICTDEKLIIDVLEHQKTIGNFDEVIKLMENCKIDEKKIINFLKRNKNLATIKRAGYLLEKIKNIDISSKFKLDKNYVKLNQLSNKTKQINSKWMVKI